MQPDARRLLHIQEAAAELASYLDDVDEDGFLSDRMRQRAVERLLTIIGEAAKQTSAATQQAIDQPWREIIRFRDKGIHGYDSLSPTTLYRIARGPVPDLAKAIARHLGTNPS